MSESNFKCLTILACTHFFKVIRQRDSCSHHSKIGFQRDLELHGFEGVPGINFQCSFSWNPPLMCIFFLCGDKNTKLDWSYQCLCYSLCWQDPQATAKWSRGKRSCLSVPPLPPDLSLSWEKQVSLVFQDVSIWGLCERKWISFMCSVNICIKGSL